MNNPFVKEIMFINCLMLVVFAVIILTATWYYGGTTENWINSLIVIGIMVLALISKKWRIKKQIKKLDERLQVITYYALSAGFYTLLAVIFWFYAKELIQDGAISTRTQVELFGGLLGYLGSYIYFKKKM